MVLPILVLIDHVRSSAVVAVEVPALSEEEQGVPPKLAACAAIEARERLVQQWRASLHLRAWPSMSKPPKVKRAVRVSNETVDQSVAFLDLCEHVLRILMRRRYRQVPKRQRRTMTGIVKSFIPATATCRSEADGQQILAWMLAAMMWRGCSHPASLCGRPLHPPTGLVRWLMQFSVTDQTDKPRRILQQLVLEVRRVDRRARFVTERICNAARRPDGEIVLLPEMLR